MTLGSVVSDIMSYYGKILVNSWDLLYWSDGKTTKPVHFYGQSVFMWLLKLGPVFSGLCKIIDIFKYLPSQLIIKQVRS